MSDKTEEQELLSAATKYRKKLAHSLKLLDEMIETIRDVTKISESPEKDSEASTSTKDGPQAVIDDLLRTSPGRWFRPKDAAEETVKRGYKPKSPKTWTTQSTVCLQRAVKKGIAQERKTDGKNEYSLKQEEKSET